MKIVAYIACTVVTGAVLAPLLFAIGKHAIPGFRLLPEDGWLMERLQSSDFGRYFNRAMLLAAVVCLFPLLRSLRMRWRDIGLRRNPARWRHFFGGFAVAAILLLAMGGVYLLIGVYEFRKDDLFKWKWEKLGKFLLTGITVGLLEEYLFRGALLGTFLRGMRRFSAVFWVTFFYAIVHFLKPPEALVVADNDVTAWSGFWMVGQIFARFGNPVVLAGEFATLFAIGWIMAWARLRTGSLWLSIGLHAGWVFSFKLYNEVTDITKRLRPDAVPPFIGADLKDGLIPLAVVLLTGVLVALVLRKSDRDRMLRADAVTSGKSS